MTSNNPELSVVVPVYNEAPCLDELLDRLFKALNDIALPYEVVAVDDGSADGSLAILQRHQAAEPHLRVVSLLRNFGQIPALYAGFSIVRGRIVVTIDADLQNPPEEIGKLVDKLREGYDVVQGWREKRHDPAFRRICSRILNKVVSYLSGVRLRDLGCGLKAYRREVVEHLVRFTHHARYVPAEVVWLGAKIAEVEVAHNERAAGQSKYSLFTLLALNFNMITSVSAAPIKIVGLIGWLFALGGLAMGVIVAIKRVLYGNFDNFVSVVAIFFFLAGVQMVATGFMCEYIGRIFIEVQNKPYFIIKNIFETDDEN